MKKIDKKYSDFSGELSLLGREKFFEVFKNDLTSSPGNIHVALDGFWGSGKTIFIKKLEDTLLVEQSIVPIYLDAWSNEFFDDPLHFLFNQLSENEGFIDCFNDAIDKKKKLKLSTSINLFFLGLNVDSVSEQSFLEEKIERSRYAMDAINETLYLFASTKKMKVVIFVDELDRCKPEFVIRLLETFRHICSENLTFVYSIDYKQLCSIINVYYGHDYGSEDYLRKIFDEVIQFPQLDDDAVINYVFRIAPESFKALIIQDIFTFATSKLDFSLRDFNRYCSELRKLKLKVFYSKSSVNEMISATIFYILLLFKVKHPLRFRNMLKSKDGRLEIVEFLRSIARLDEIVISSKKFNGSETNLEEVLNDILGDKRNIVDLTK